MTEMTCTEGWKNGFIFITFKGIINRWATKNQRKYTGEQLDLSTYPREFTKEKSTKKEKVIIVVNKLKTVKSCPKNGVHFKPQLNCRSTLCLSLSILIQRIFFRLNT